MTYTICKPILECSLIKHIFCQNIHFVHEKASFIPIGIANRQWPHGNPEFIKNVNRPINKQNEIICSFKVSTNTTIRANCLTKIKKLGIDNIHFSTQQEYVTSLASYKFCICPEGNGTDTHRFWESLFLETIPIVVRTPLTEQIYRSGIPCVLIDSWDTFDSNSLPEYSSFKFDETYYNTISFMRVRTDILNKVSTLYDSMNVVLSFIGNMPPYIVECIQQLRLFFDGPIYLIHSTIEPSIKNDLDKFSLIYIDYKEVESERFNIKSRNTSFCVVDRLNDRRELFKRSYERIYLLDTLMLKKNLTNVWFMEIDILMYCNPTIFRGALHDVPYAYCYADNDHCSSAILYVKNVNTLQEILYSLDNFNDSFVSEMRAIRRHLNNNQNTTLFSLIPKTPTNSYFWKDYNLFYTFIFDGAVIGQYLFGVDREDSKIKDTTFISNHIHMWEYGNFEWYKNNKQLYIPYYRLHTTQELIPIANLHIHSKKLIAAVSYTDKVNN
jgi:hypothetical protein